jgi:phenylacetate-CoA ligase
VSVFRATAILVHILNVTVYTLHKSSRFAVFHSFSQSTIKGPREKVKDFKMPNWRKPLLFAALSLKGSNIPKFLKQIRTLERLPIEEIQIYQRNKLEKLVHHAFDNVPFYRSLFSSTALVKESGQINFDNWLSLPVLTKELVRENFVRLQSIDWKDRKGFINTSGGSTGEPVRFMQDPVYRDWNFANKIYYKTFAGQEIGQPEWRLWGSERDILGIDSSFSAKAQNWLYNRKEHNAFRLSEKDFFTWVEEWNLEQPTWLEAYVQPLYELARFIVEKGIIVHSPKGVLTSAGTLYPTIKETIEKAFSCSVFNRYGSREVGDVACCCSRSEGLHLSPWNHWVEILDANGCPVTPGESGRIVVTTLNNFSQPLIRYDIGDIGVQATNPTCSCGRNTPLVAKVEGREMCLFKTPTGDYVPGEFFIHFIGVVFNDGAIKKFQVIQKDYNLIQIKVVLAKRDNFESGRADIEQSIRKVMGGGCRVEWLFVEQIEALSSGKYLYTRCEI